MMQHNILKTQFLHLDLFIIVPDRYFNFINKNNILLTAEQYSKYLITETQVEREEAAATWGWAATGVYGIDAVSTPKIRTVLD